MITLAGCFGVEHLFWYMTRDKNVVADFMVPYHAEDISPPEAEEPPLTKPDLIPDLILNKGVTILPSRQKFITGKLETFKVDLQPQIETQQKSFQVFKDSVDTLAKVYTSFGSVKGKAGSGTVFQDPKLGTYTQTLNDKADCPEIPARPNKA